MKKLASILLLTLASTSSFANCSINFIASTSLKNSISKKGFTIDSNVYQNLCSQLQKNKAGIHFLSMDQISTYQTTSFVNIALYSLDDKLSMRTLASHSMMQYNQERTTTTSENQLYSLSMDTMSSLFENQKDLDLMFKQLREVRINLK